MDADAGFEPEVGEIRALRTFRIGPGGLLYPLFSDLAWVDGINTASCKLSPPPPPQTIATPAHIAPESDCTCGFYAYASEAAASEYPQARHVLAVVACWGRVIVGTRGIRAEHVQVEAVWTSERVPDELAASVAERYRSASLYRDKATMLSQHPPTQLESYEAETRRRRTTRNLGLRLAILAALIVGLLPANWDWQNHDTRLIWAVELGFFAVCAAVLSLVARQGKARGALFFGAVILWLIAPFAGLGGILLLRLPILQIAVVGGLHCAQLRWEAARFPAAIVAPDD